MKTYVILSLVLLTTHCSRKTLVIDDAEKPAQFVLTTPENVNAVEVNATGLLSGSGRLHFLTSLTDKEPWRTIEIHPVIVSGIPMGITPVSLEADYGSRQLVIRYEPGPKTEGHLEIQYRFRQR